MKQAFTTTRYLQERKKFDLRDSGAVLWQLWQDWMVICFAYFRLGCGGHRFPESCVEKKR